MPRKQFVLDGARFEERDGGRILWTGSAGRADGDLSETDVEDVEIVTRPATPEQRPYRVRSKSGRLLHDAGEALLHDVHILDAGAGSLTATSAHYVQQARRIDVAGPLRFTTPNLVAIATQATVFIDENRVDVAGPIAGTLHDGAPPKGAP